MCAGSVPFLFILFSTNQSPREHLVVRGGSTVGMVSRNLFNSSSENAFSPPAFVVSRADKEAN